MNVWPRMISSEKLLSHLEMLVAVEELVTLCTWNYDALYPPGEELITGMCPRSGCGVVYR